MGGRTGPVFSGIAANGLGVDLLDPLNFMREPIANWDMETGKVDIFFVPFWALLECVSKMLDAAFQVLDLAFQVYNDGLIKVLLVFDGAGEPLGDGMEGDGINVVMLEDCACSVQGYRCDGVQSRDNLIQGSGHICWWPAEHYCQCVCSELWHAKILAWLH